MADEGRKSRLIYVSGNNGSGKTTLGKALAARLGFSHLPEDDSSTPYLWDLFSRPKRWSFEAQTHFLSLKVHLVRHCVTTSTNAVIDRTPSEDAQVFARYFYDAGRMDKRAYRTYQQLYEVLIRELPEPDLIIYCRCSLAELERRVRRRGRDYEQLYPPNHLEVLEQLYASWLREVTHLHPGKVYALDTETHDFVTDHELLGKAASDVRYVLGRPAPQLELFPQDLSQQGFFGDEFRFWGLLTPVVLDQVRLQKYRSRKPLAYIAAPFTGRATANATPDISSASEPPAAYFRSWVDAAAPHGKIEDLEYRQYLEGIECIVHQSGYTTFLPHRDVNRWGDRQLTARQGAAECTKQVLQADVVVALPQFSLGAHYEIGVAVGHGIPVVVLLAEGTETSFIMQGLGLARNVSAIRFSSLSDLQPRLRLTLTDLALRLPGLPAQSIGASRGWETGPDKSSRTQRASRKSRSVYAKKARPSS